MEARFTIDSSMSKEDYRIFLYTSIFRKSRVRIIILLLTCLLASFVISYDDAFNTMVFLIAMFLFVVFIFSAIVFNIERRYSQRIKTDKTGIFNNTHKLIFFEDKLVTESISPKSQGELKYEQFYELIETNDYWYFYMTINQASLLSKRNIRENSYNVEEFGEFIREKFKDRYKKI